MSFSLTFEPLDTTHPSWGSMAIVPWDSEIFGFRVAQFAPGDDIPPNAIAEWATRNDVALISAECAPTDRTASRTLQRCGFALVDIAIIAILPRLQRVELPEPRRETRLATNDDLPHIESIAVNAFTAGRYHADPFFPRALADERYRHWIQNAFDDASSTMLVIGTVAGFFHVVIRDDEADLRLTAVNPSRADPFTGRDLFIGALQHARTRGARRAIARLSASNIAALNLYASLGFRFDAPRAIYHWRSSRLIEASTD